MARDKITYAVGHLVASLKVDAGAICDGALVRVDAILSVDGPSLALLVAAGQQVSDVSQNVLVDVTFVARCHNDKIDVERLLARGLGHLILAAVVADVQAHTIIG